MIRVKNKQCIRNTNPIQARFKGSFQISTVLVAQTC